LATQGALALLKSFSLQFFNSSCLLALLVGSVVGGGSVSALLSAVGHEWCADCSLWSGTAPISQHLVVCCGSSTNSLKRKKFGANKGDANARHKKLEIGDDFNFIFDCGSGHTVGEQDFQHGDI